MNYCFGVDIGGTTIKMGLFSEDGMVIDKWEIVTRTQEEGYYILPDVVESIISKLEEHKIEKENIIGIGVGVPAPVSDQGIVNGSANLGWKYKEVSVELNHLLGIEILVGNDANVAALGEMWKGGGMGHKDLAMVTLGTGVGGGIIVKEQIVSGANGAGGEIGHLCVNYEEIEACGCGNYGCLEQYASAQGIVRLAKRRLKNNTDATILKEDGISAKSVFDAVKEKDAVAIEIAEQFGRYLGYALANMSVLIDPAIIVIGGGVSKAGDILLSFIEKNFVKRAFFANKNTQFALARLGNDAGIYGAAKMVLTWQANNIKKEEEIAGK